MRDLKSLLFLVGVIPLMTFGQISQMEYFFDSDPGFGNGTPISIATPDSVVLLSGEIFNSSALTLGFHNLFIRGFSNTIVYEFISDSAVFDIDTISTWGHYESRLVFVDTEGSLLVDIDAVEYFFDADPGYGSGTIINVTPSNLQSFTDSIDASALPLGFHNLFLRARASGGSWGPAVSRLVYVDQSAAIKDNIEAIEYFFDVDPGYGNGSIINVTPEVQVSFLDSLVALNLPLGFHNLFVRVRDVGGNWGQAESRLVYVDQSASIAENIDAFEYFFDSDPGYGNGTLVDITPSVIVNFSDSLDGASLPIGFHNLFVRMKDSNGVWGQADSRLVYVGQSGALITDIDAYEYFFDSDPGYGNGTLVDVTPSVIVNFSDSLDGTSLPIGFHNLFVRMKDTNGVWGPADSRLVYVDQSGALIADIDTYEYFFDSDPGYGNGAVVSIDASQNVFETDTLIADTLASGFHNLYTRFRNTEGQWGSAESRLVFVDSDGNVVAPIEELEYFFDSDPGFGLAQSIPIAPPEEMAVRDFNISTASLSEGQHTLFVRVKNSNGVWGLSESYLFTTYGLGRELDSVALAYVYGQLGGDNWINRAGWLTGSLDTWEGITVNNNRVDSVSLSDNLLAGSIPFQLSYLNEMRSLDLSLNQLQDTVPLEFEDLTALQELRLNGNQLHELPDLSGLANLSVTHLDTNLFDFGDLEPLSSVATYTYDNQQLYQDQAVDSLVSIGQAWNWTVPVEGVNNRYQWYRNDEAIDFADLAIYEVNAFSQEDTGTYRLEVNNALLPNLTLNSANYRFRISGFEQDSLAMVSLYESTNGAEWTNQTNWLTGPLSTWEGITLDQDRISQLSLPNNNLSGILPVDLAVANALTVVDLSQNNLTDSVPGSINEILGLVSLNLASNDLNSIPIMAPLQSLSTLNVSGNRIQFGDLETNLGINNLIYSPMDSLTVGRDTLMESGDNVTLEFEFSGANNSYQWYKNEVAISGATASRLDIQAIDFEDEGTYRLEVTNSLIPDLTLTSGELRVGVTSLERDQAALRELYQQAGGESWEPPVKWLTDEIEQWGEEVILNNDNTRVISVSLPARGLSGEIPSKIRDITSLEAFDVSGNNLTAVPNLSQMTKLASFDVRQNQLQIPDIERNIAVSGFSFNPQQKVNVLEDTILISQGTSTVLTSGLAGINNLYFWKRNGQEVAQTSQKSYIIDSITYDNMGLYSVEATSAIIQEIDSAFRLVTQDQSILATANIEFLPTFSFADGTEALVETGTSTLVRVQDSGPYPIVDSVDIVNERIFFPNIILGDYLLSARAADGYLRVLNGDSVQFIPTYFENELEWDSADVLTLREDLSDALLMLRIPPPLRPVAGNDGVIEMTVESDFADNNGARLDARRKVKKAGCSLRRNRTVSGGRTENEEEWELIAYQETDDNGEVDFGFLPSGLYRINIQYPGVPMDPNSFIEFEITQEEEKDGYVLSATIFEDRIEVVVIEELGFVRNYFQALEVFPNPVDGELTLRYDRLFSDQVKYQFINLEGKVLIEGGLDKGKQVKEIIPTSALPKGYYLLKIYDKGTNRHLITYKLIISH